MEGYITVATDKRKYLTLAINLALSVKLNGTRPISLLHDGKISIPDACRKFFDKIIQIAPEDLLVGVTNKLLLLKYSPYERTIYIDADCLMMKKDMDFFWELLKKYSFTVQGWKLTTGRWQKIDVAPYIKKFGLPYLVQANCGVVYFDKSETARKVFDKMMDYLKNYKDSITWISHGVPGQYFEEPIFCAAMSFYHLEPFPAPIGDKALTCSTVYTRNHEMDVFKNVCSFIKKTSHVSPTICHFVEIKPRDMYIRESKKLRKLFGLMKIES